MKKWSCKIIIINNDFFTAKCINEQDHDDIVLMDFNNNEIEKKYLALGRIFIYDGAKLTVPLDIVYDDKFFEMMNYDDPDFDNMFE